MIRYIILIYFYFSIISYQKVINYNLESTIYYIKYNIGILEIYYRLKLYNVFIIFNNKKTFGIYNALK